MDPKLRFVIDEYISKRDLHPQDVIKCYLKLSTLITGDSYYDYRRKLWDLKPGDVIFTKGSFQPLVSYPKIDDTLNHVRCGHIDDDVKTKKALPTCSCRKWYLYYKTDKGTIRKMYPQWDGLTTIPQSKIFDMLETLDGHSDIDNLQTHFTSGFVTQKELSLLMREISHFQK
jgi:hypothetical protein